MAASAPAQTHRSSGARLVGVLIEIKPSAGCLEEVVSQEQRETRNGQHAIRDASLLIAEEDRYCDSATAVALRAVAETVGLSLYLLGHLLVKAKSTKSRHVVGVPTIACNAVATCRVKNPKAAIGRGSLRNVDLAHHALCHERVPRRECIEWPVGNERHHALGRPVVLLDYADVPRTRGTTRPGIAPGRKALPASRALLVTSPVTGLTAVEARLIRVGLGSATASRTTAARTSFRTAAARWRATRARRSGGTIASASAATAAARAAPAPTTTKPLARVADRCESLGEIRHGHGGLLKRSHAVRAENLLKFLVIEVHGREVLLEPIELRADNLSDLWSALVVLLILVSLLLLLVLLVTFVHHVCRPRATVTTRRGSR